MTTNEKTSPRSIDVEIASVIALIECLRIMGTEPAGVLVDISAEAGDGMTMLCIFGDIVNSRVRCEDGTRTIPAFVPHRVAYAMHQRGLYDITAQSSPYGVNSWWVKFSDTFI